MHMLPKPRKRRNHYGNRSACGTGKCLGTGGNDRGKAIRDGDQNRYANSEGAAVYFSGHRRRDGAASAASVKKR
jgi:hypothetical protein